MAIPFVYLVITIAVATIASLTRDNVKHYLGFALLWSWTVANFCVFEWGFAEAPIFLATGELLLAILTASIGYMNRSMVALIIVGLFGAQEAIQIGFYAVERQGSHWYYFALNMAHIAQLAVLGGASLGPSLRRFWAGRFGSRLERYLLAYRTGR